MSTRKLLLADDSITIQKVVNLTFADEGIEVIAVSNGDSAMEKMSEIKPDLVMADINMPGLSGYQVCERIKQDDNFRQTPVILLVGSFEPFDEEEARRVGADDFLTKPFQSIRQLVNKVTFLLDAKEQGAPHHYDATANSSFAETLDMETPEIGNSDQTGDLGDAGMDDEMIQTNQINSFALDESAKFETKEDSAFEDSEDSNKTQPLSVYDLKEFSFVAESPENQPPVYENTNSDEPESRNFNESALAVTTSEEEKKENFSSFLDSSDDDFLEIPPDEDEEWESEEPSEETNPPSIAEAIETQDSETVATGETQERDFIGEQGESANQDFSSPEYGDESAAEKFNEYSQPQETVGEISSLENDNKSSIQESDLAEDASSVTNEIVVGTLIEPENNSKSAEENLSETTESSYPSEASTQFSPELIDAIAQKVIEKLSDKVVREIAWEVVPQHADLVIRKMVEEKLKE